MLLLKAQSSIEFMIFYGILSLILVLIAFISITTSNAVLQENINEDAKGYAQLLATEINIAAAVGDGYSRNFTLPYSIKGGVDYNITTGPQKIIIMWNNYTYSLPVLAYNITGSPRKGPNIVKNVGGVIMIA